MNATETHAIGQHANDWTHKRAASGSFTEAIGAFGVIVLAIIGLVGLLAHSLAAIATIVVGAAILVEGRALTSGHGQLMAREGDEGQALEWSRGVTAEFMGGVAGIVLGILALFGTYPETLLGAAVIVFGATFLLTSTAVSQLNWLLGFQMREKAGGEPLRELPAADSGGQVLVGLSAVVLGILAVIGLSPMTLVLVVLSRRTAQLAGVRPSQRCPHPTGRRKSTAP